MPKSRLTYVSSVNHPSVKTFTANTYPLIRKGRWESRDHISMGLKLQKGATELVDSIIATCWTA
jgi:hypothetical protein